MKILSAVLLPRWEEEVEEGEHSPLTSILSRAGERKIKERVFTGGKRGIFFMLTSRSSCGFIRVCVIVFCKVPWYLFAARRDGDWQAVDRGRAPRACTGVFLRS